MFKFISTLAIASVVAVPVAFAAPPGRDSHHRHHPGDPGHHMEPHTAPHHMRPNHMRPGHMHYRPGHRYRHAPHGWHRYHRRPGDWRTRGCIMVGPVWFCP